MARWSTFSLRWRHLINPKYEKGGDMNMWDLIYNPTNIPNLTCWYHNYLILGALFSAFFFVQYAQFSVKIMELFVVVGIPVITAWPWCHNLQCRSCQLLFSVPPRVLTTKRARNALHPGRGGNDDRPFWGIISSGVTKMKSAQVLHLSRLIIPYVRISVNNLTPW
jgi:hypothetical protein